MDEVLRRIVHTEETMKTEVITASDCSIIVENFKNRFYRGMDVEEFKSGIRPTVCIMPESDYVALRLMANDATFVKQFSSVDKGMVQFIGVDCFESSTIDRMVFGYRHES